MFKKIDDFWFMARAVIYILLGIMLVVSFVIPIVNAITLQNFWLLLYIIPSIIGCVLFWVFAELLLSFLLDVKLIRNKLYDEKSSQFEEYVRQKKDEFQE